MTLMQWEVDSPFQAEKPLCTIPLIGFEWTFATWTNTAMVGGL